MFLTQMDPEGIPVTTPPAPDFPTLYRNEFAYAWKTLRRLGAPSRDLEDLVHDVFVVVHRQLATYDPNRPLRPWLFGIAVRVLGDYRRAFRNSRELLAATAPRGDGFGQGVDVEPSQDDRLAGAEERRLLMKALDLLDFDRRAVLVMHDLDEVAMPEIATTLDIPLNTAYSRLRLARADVAVAIKRCHQRGGGS